MNWIDYRELPPSAGFSDLFLDYIAHAPDARRFFSGHFRENRSYEAVMEAIDARPPDRALLADVLLEQNKAWGSGPRALENAGFLRDATAYAVVTGQQVGLFGGPIYTIYKTMTAIRFAERLRAKYPGKKFIPVFWLEGEDHDFGEMNHVKVLDADNLVKRVDYLPGGQMPDRNPGPVGEIVFDGTLDQTYQQIGASVQRTEFTDALLSALRECYAQGRTFNHAFAAWMGRLFRDAGLVFISSNDLRLKKLLIPLFVRELEGFPSVSQIVIGQSAELEQRYHAQIKPGSINLFMFHKGGRYLITPREHDFSLKGTRHFIQREEMMRIARENPELLSPNVVLRPLSQDILLPTVAYVAGPAEVAYQAQLTPVYQHFGVQQPVIYPRSSASIIDERLGRVMEKYDLPVLDFFGDTSQLTARVLEQISEVKVDQIFDRTLEMVRDGLNELHFGLNEIDPTLLGALENLKTKTEANISGLRAKSHAAQKRLHEVAVRQIERAVAGLLPDGNLQEREINLVSFMNKYGQDFVHNLFSQLEIDGFKHQILRQPGAAAGRS